MKPTLIPCNTGKTNTNHRRHLYSPSEKRGLIRASEQTIVDCFTYGLKLNRRRIDPKTHYLWYISLAETIQHDPDIVLIAPDFDWLGPEITAELAELWLQKITVKTITVPGSYLFDRIPFENTVGYALTSNRTGPVHPKWTHSFSQYYGKIDGVTDLWTYDTTATLIEE